MNKIFTGITFFLLVGTVFAQAKETNNNKNQYTNIKQYKSPPIPEANMKPNYGSFVKKFPERVKEEPKFIKESKYSAKKGINLFGYSNIYLSAAIGQEFLYRMSINNKLSNDYNIPEYTIKHGSFAPTSGFDINPLLFNIALGYRPFEKPYINGLRFEFNYNYVTKDDYRLINYDGFFKNKEDINHEAYRSELDKNTYNIGLVAYYDFYFLTGEQNLIVPYVGMGVHKGFGKIDMISSYVDRKNGIDVLSEESLHMNLNTVDVSQHVGLNLFKGYVFTEYTFNSHLGKNFATSSYLKFGFRIPMVAM